MTICASVENSREVFLSCMILFMVGMLVKGSCTTINILVLMYNILESSKVGLCYVTCAITGYVILKISYILSIPSLFSTLDIIWLRHNSHSDLNNIY